MKKRGKNSLIIAVDLKSAFDSPLRAKLWESIKNNWGDSEFLKAYREILEEIELVVDLNFTTVGGIKSRRGAPQGMKLSA